LITFGFSIEQFFRIAKVGVEESKDLIGPQEFGLLMISIGLVALLLATLQNRSAIQALWQYTTRRKRDSQRFPARGHLMLAALIAILGLLALFSMMLRQ
jgi:uncharacterized membrane protein YidH (DUF202 family)